MVGEGEATATGEATASGEAEDIVTKEPTVMEKEATATEEDIVTEEEAHVVNEDTIEFQERVPNVTVMERGESNVEDEGKVEGERRRKVLAGITIASTLLGFIMLVVGSVLLAQYSIFLDFVTSRYTETAVFLLVMGIVIMVVSAVGLYAALKFHFCLMTTFLVLMVAAVVMEVIASVTFFALNNDPSVRADTRLMLRRTLQTWVEGGHSAEDQFKTWNLIQVELQCCGLEGALDYSPHSALPASCCAGLRVTLAGTEPCRKETPTLQKHGCAAAFRSFLGRKVGVIGGVAVVVALLQVAVIYSASSLVKRWRIPGHCYPCY